MPRGRLIGLALAVVLGVAVLAAVTGPGEPSRPDPRPVDRTLRRVQVGTAPTGATIVVQGPLARPRPVVVFLHGWRLQGPRAYRAWTTHLAREGNVVIVPRYQSDRRQEVGEVLGNAVAGIRAALRRTRIRPGTLVVAGHSAGGALAADYAAMAGDGGLPEPRAIFAVYPGRVIRAGESIPAFDGARIPAATRIVALAGSTDEVVGRAPAEQLVAAATAVPAERRQLVTIDAPGA